MMQCGCGNQIQYDVSEGVFIEVQCPDCKEWINTPDPADYHLYDQWLTTIGPPADGEDRWELTTITKGGVRLGQQPGGDNG